RHASRRSRLRYSGQRAAAAGRRTDMRAGEAGLDIRDNERRPQAVALTCEPGGEGDPTGSDRAAFEVLRELVRRLAGPYVNRFAGLPASRLLQMRGLKDERLRPPVLAERERELRRRPQSGWVRRLDGRARLLVLKRAEHVLEEEAVFAARH